MQRVIVFLLVWTLVPVAAADHPPISASAQWYVHVNLERMRHATSGRHLYDYLYAEVLSDLADEFGAETISSIEALTLFGGRSSRFGLLLHALLDGGTRGDLLEKLHAGPVLDGFGGHEVYAIAPASLSPGKLEKATGGSDMFLAFGRLNQVLVTTDRTLLDEFVAVGAHFTDEPATELLVVRAGDPLVRGAFDNRGEHGSGAFQSHMLRNVEQFGLVLGEVGRQYDLRIELLTPTPETAAALRNVVFGLMSLHVLVDEAHAGAHELLGRVNIDTDANRVSLGLLMDPEELLQLLN